MSGTSLRSRPRAGMTWNTGSTVFAVAPRSATARRNAPDTVVALTPGSASGRTHCIASSLMRCAISMQRSSSSVLVSFAGPSTTLASHTDRPASAVHRGKGASSSAIGPSLSSGHELLGAFGGLDCEPLLDHRARSGALGELREEHGARFVGAQDRDRTPGRCARSVRGRRARAGEVRDVVLPAADERGDAGCLHGGAHLGDAARRSCGRSRPCRTVRQASRGLTSSRGRGPGSTSSTVV